MANQSRRWSRPLIAVAATTVTVLSVAAGVALGPTKVSAATNCPEQTKPDLSTTEVNCLFFTATAEPANAVRSTSPPSITSEAFNTSGPAVSVVATDDENNPLSGVPVTLKLLPSGTLLGTVTETTDSSGVATFGSLAVDTTGYYQLEASTSASQFNTTTSTVFFIADTAQPCSGITSCSESLADQTGNASATVVNAGDDILSLGLGGLPYNCPGYTTVSGAIATDVWHGNIIDNAISAQTTLVINKTTVEQRGPDDGASSFQVCYAEQKASASQAPFTTLSGAPASTTMLPVGSQTLTFYVGLLPDCRSKSPQAPCLLSRHKDNAGDVILTFLGTGDYFGSG